LERQAYVEGAAKLIFAIACLYAMMLLFKVGPGL
jgi:hypothetical protein